MENLTRYRSELEGKNLVQTLQWAIDTFGVQEVALSSSLGVEDQLLTHYFIEQNPKARIFTLDTGRMFQENYAVMSQSMSKYSFQYEITFPEKAAIAELMNQGGPNLFYDSVASRKACCEVRKLAPLRNILSTCKAWITGLRASQSVTRTDMELIEWDENFGLYKLNPLMHWDEDEVWNEIKKYEIPYNALHDQGYPSIGCQPCTRAVEPGEDIRAGRWWWEQPEHKECGLHFDDEGNIVRGNS